MALIALRNLSRNRRRTLLSVLVIAAGTASLLLTIGFLRHSFEGLAEAFIASGLGHLEISPSTEGDDRVDRAGESGLTRWREAQQTVEAADHVIGATGAIVFHGLISHGERSVPFAGAALEPDRTARVGLRPRLRAGRFLSEEYDSGEEALLGLGLARQLRAKVGDVVTLLSLDAAGMLNALDVEVVGLLTTGVEELDARFLRVRLQTAQRLLGTDAVDSLIVVLDDTEATTAAQLTLARRLERGRHEITIRGWKERAPFYSQVYNLYLGIFAVLGTIVVLLVGLSSTNVLVMTVMERVPEIGALLALGTSSRQVVQLVAMEAAWLGVIGGSVGSLIGAATASLIRALGVTLPPPPGAVEPMLLELTMTVADAAIIVGLMTLLLTATGVIPTSRVLRMRIAEALTHH